VPVSSGPELIGPFPDGVDPVAYDRERRRVLWRFPTGLYLLGSRHEGRRNLMTCSFVTQLATRPKIVGVGVETESVSAGLISASGWFALSMLARTDRDVVRRFVKPAVEDQEAHTLSGQEFTDAPSSGAPVLARALASLDCRVRETVDLGSHKLFAGEVYAASFGNVEGAEDAPLLRMEDTRMNYGG
jgi:flavin reductase (DIM6/NTAB) family NADH-FMN oxidoreductase RutF